MATIRGPRIVTSGLVFCANAADKKSYTGSGTSWKDLTEYSANGTLNGGMTFSNNNGGYLITGGYASYKYCDWGTGLSQINFTSQNFTVMVMFKSNSEPFTSGRVTGLFSYGRVFISGYYVLLNKAGSNRLGFFTNGFGSNQVTISSDFSGYSGKWTLVSFVRNGTSVKIYANTTDITETAATHINPDSNTTFPLILASSTESGTVTDMTWDGQFASFMIYNRALSVSEISQNFNAQRGRFGI